MKLSIKQRDEISNWIKMDEDMHHKRMTFKMDDSKKGEDMSAKLITNLVVETGNKNYSKQ